MSLNSRPNILIVIAITYHPTDNIFINLSFVAYEYITDTFNIKCVPVLDTRRCLHQYDTLTLIITLNYVVFINFYRCQSVNVCIVSGVHVCVYAS